MNEYQISFLVEDPNASATVAKPLSRLAKKFKSQVRIINITRNRTADLSRSMAMLQAALVEGDLCQITAFGIDAELACFVLKDLIAEHFSLIGAQINYQFSNQLIERHPQLSPPSATEWWFAKAQTGLTKFECLKGLAQLIYPTHPDELILSFIKREERSSTCVTPGIALPHVMFDGVEQISVAVISSDSPIDWASKMGNVHLAIALVMPSKPTRQQIITATNLTRNLLCDQLSDRLRNTKNPIELQALLMYSMTRILA